MGCATTTFGGGGATNWFLEPQPVTASAAIAARTAKPGRRLSSSDVRPCRIFMPHSPFERRRYHLLIRHSPEDTAGEPGLDKSSNAGEADFHNKPRKP